MSCSLCLAYFKGKTDTGPPKKKKKCKKKHFKEKSSDEKKLNPKSQQKSSPSPAAQKGPASAKLNGSKSQSTIVYTPQPPKGIFHSYCLFLLYKCVFVSYSQILSRFFLTQRSKCRVQLLHCRCTAQETARKDWRVQRAGRQYLKMVQTTKGKPHGGFFIHCLYTLMTIWHLLVC